MLIIEVKHSSADVIPMPSSLWGSRGEVSSEESAGEWELWSLWEVVFSCLSGWAFTFESSGPVRWVELAASLSVSSRTNPRVLRSRGLSQGLGISGSSSSFRPSLAVSLSVSSNINFSSLRPSQGVGKLYSWLASTFSRIWDFDLRRYRTWMTWHFRFLINTGGRRLRFDRGDCALVEASDACSDFWKVSFVYSLIETPPWAGSLFGLTLVEQEDRDRDIPQITKLVLTFRLFRACVIMA